MWMQRKAWLSVIFLATFGLAACGGSSGSDGGGDGGGSDSTTSTLNDSNSDDVATGTYSTANGVAGSGASQTDAYVSANVTEGARHSAIEATRRVLEMVREDSAASTNEQFVSSVSPDDIYSCPNGGEYEIIDSIDPDDSVLEKDDKFEIVFRDCDLSTLLIDGGFTFEVTKVENGSAIGGTSTSWSYTVKLTYKQWTFSGSLALLLDGSMTLKYAYDSSNDEYTSTVSGGPLTFESGATSSKLSNIDIVYITPNGSNAYTLNADFTNEYSGSEFSGTVTVNTADSDRLQDDGSTADSNTFPDTGFMTITDSDGNKAEIDASQCSNTEFQLTYTDSGGATTTECRSW